MTNFIGFPKIPRLSRECIITEKLDGTNAQIFITPWPKPSEGQPDARPPHMLNYFYAEDGSAWGVYAGSRHRWLKSEDDNYGFAAWVLNNIEDLRTLGPGQHFGEWWGQGIQRGYGLTEKRFSLFNTSRWNEETKPKCCHVVPIIYQGLFTDMAYTYALDALEAVGSAASPGFMNPEGIIIYHTALNGYFKKTIHKDKEHKGSK